jgi:hypothetical protein
MMTRIYFIPAFVLCLVFSLPIARADVVVLKTGKKVEVEKVWRENGKIWIVYQGMPASLPQSKVERIESEAKKTPTPPPRSPSIQPTRHTAQSTPMPPPAKLSEEQRRIFSDGQLSKLRWGTKTTRIKGLEKILDAEDQEGVSEYRQEADHLTLGKAELTSINYAFWRDRLYMLTIVTRGRSNFEALRGEVFRQFGRGLRTEPDLERYLWTEGPSDLLLQYSKDGKQGLLWLRSSELDRQYKLSQIRSQASFLNWMKSGN